MGAKRNSLNSGVAAPQEQLIFKTADVFAEAATTVLQKAWSEVKPHLNFAFGVNAALATELYLKCLLVIECNQCPRKHSLKVLFEQLRRETRHLLKKKHANAVNNDSNLAVLRKHGVKTDLDSLLEKGKDVFELFRYPYESTRAKDVFFGLSGLANCVREHILTLRPEWIDDGVTQSRR